MATGFITYCTANNTELEQLVNKWQTLDLTQKPQAVRQSLSAVKKRNTRNYCFPHLVKCYTGYIRQIPSFLSGPSCSAASEFAVVTCDL